MTIKSTVPLPTLADLDALPPGIVGEIIEGVLYEMPYPGTEHQHVLIQIIADLGWAFSRGSSSPGRWWILHRLPSEFPDGTLEIVPDVAGWRRERMPVLSDHAPNRVVPDWTCEIVSSRTRHHDVTIKRPYYARIGVPHLWLVDIEERVVIAHRLDADRYTVIGRYREGSEVRIEPFDAVPLNVAAWWP